VLGYCHQGENKYVEFGIHGCGGRSL
jgi:hypothetical protein